MWCVAVASHQKWAQIQCEFFCEDWKYYCYSHTSKQAQKSYNSKSGLEKDWCEKVQFTLGKQFPF